MCEINVRNFKNLLPEIKRSFQASKFISVDLEFSALYPLPDRQPSIVDSPAERYCKLKAQLESVIPLQIGLTAFHFDADENSYCGKVYTFYVKPASFQFLHRTCSFHTAAVDFLKFHNFDFNKSFCDGVPFINEQQEAEFRRRWHNNELSELNMSFHFLLSSFLTSQTTIIKAWYDKANIDETLALETLPDGMKTTEEISFFIHMALRETFPYLWTYMEGNTFVVRKVSKEEFARLQRKHSLEESTLDNLLGFTKVFRFLADLKKPLVGHNLLLDLLLMANSFGAGLPKTYSGFKHMISDLFPAVYDTKFISIEVAKKMSEDKRWENKGLDQLFDYFKNGTGRHLAPNSPAIEMNSTEETYGKFHNGGWDSFCAGYVFIRLAHLNIYKKFPTTKEFLSSELLAGLTPCRNMVNVVRGSVSHINLDGPDPRSTRPPYLVIESRKNKPVGVQQVTSLLSKHGYVEAKRLQKSSVLIAIDSYGNANRIIREFRDNPEYRAVQYNTLKHSPLAKVYLMGGLTVSGLVIFYLAYNSGR